MTDSPPRWAAVASFAAPFALAALCAGGGMGFWDSPELAAGGAGLGVTHPPGHPLFAVLGSIAALVPAGPLPFRLALMSALCLGLVGRMAFAAAHRVARDVGGASVSVPRRAALALAAAMSATLGVASFRQATRVEVYALAMAAVAALLVLALDTEQGAWRARAGMLVLGLGAANHHFIALTAAPVLGMTLWARLREARARGGGAAAGRTLGVWAGLFALGLVPYALLPARANAPASQVRVHSARELVDTISARVYAHNTQGVPGSVGQRALEVMDWLGESLTSFGLLFAAAGLYLAARSEKGRGHAARLALLALVASAARTWLGFVRGNPDAAGYLTPAVLALAVATAGFGAGASRAIAEAPAAPKGPSRAARVALTVVLVGGPVVLPLYLAVSAVRASAVDRSSVPELLAHEALRDLPPRTLVFAYDPQTIFRLRFAQLVEGERPDVTVVPDPLLGYPGMVSWLLAQDAALRPVMTQYLLRPEQGLSAGILSSLAVQRAVEVELDVRNLHDNVGYLLPRGLLYVLRAEPTTLAAVHGAAAPHFTRQEALGVLLDRDADARSLVNDALGWRAYMDALFFAARGARPEARRAVAAGLARLRGARELEGLRDALNGPGDGPIDVGPFITRGR